MSTIDEHHSRNPDRRTRRGRPLGHSSDDAEREILQAARIEFGRRGYDDATIRAIAKSAHCDPKLVHYYFGSKEKLFSQVIVDIYRQQDLGGILQQSAERTTLDVTTEFAREYLRTVEMPGIQEAYIALIRGIGSNEHVRTIFLQFLHEQIMALTGDTLRLDNAKLRTTLFGSQLLGLANMRYVLKLEPLASMPVEQLAELIAPTLEHYLFGDLNVNREQEATSHP
ncbi:TetR/AcrR family transcriptional regulator [Bifidobacterium sp.]|uniref:TetR/AcrR family transcriptional regulator n=1 Tax=Bifidobacterium sp. TaxID=41200 RepID=UPI0039EBB2CF